MKKLDYAAKLETMVHNSIVKGTYTKITDMLKKNYWDIRTFFIETLNVMKPDSNQPARLFGTAKIQSLKRKKKKKKTTTVLNLKLRSIIDQAETFM